MPRKPSAETELRRVRRELKEKTKDALEYHDEAYRQRGRATKAEQETAEWKRRFDLLLAKLRVFVVDPEDPEA